MTEESLVWTKQESGAIVLATDGSASALAATIRAINHAKREGKSVHVITVSSPSPLIGVEKLAEDYAVGRRCKVDGVWFAENYGAEQDISLSIVRKDGPIAGAIVEYAIEVDADLIVMGSSNLRGVAGFVLGDVSEAVLRLSPCSVWAVKPTREEIERVVQTVKRYVKPARKEAPQDLIPDKTLWKVGLTMFTLYVAAYAGFTIAGTFMKGILSVRIFNLNLGIISGMTIIIAAVAIALIYNWYAGSRSVLV